MVKIRDDAKYGHIRAAICDAYIAAGKPEPERDWLYRRLVEARAQIEQMNGTLLMAMEIIEALKPLIPRMDSVSGEQLAQWQRVVNAIFSAAEYETQRKVPR